MTTQTLREWGEVKPLNEFPVSRASTDDRERLVPRLSRSGEPGVPPNATATA